MLATHQEGGEDLIFAESFGEDPVIISESRFRSDERRLIRYIAETGVHGQGIFSSGFWTTAAGDDRLTTAHGKRDAPTASLNPHLRQSAEAGATRWRRRIRPSPAPRNPRSSSSACSDREPEFNTNASS